MALVQEVRDEFKKEIRQAGCTELDYDDWIASGIHITYSRWESDGCIYFALFSIGEVMRINAEGTVEM